MLGLGGISSRGISGSPFSLVAIPMSLAASGAFITFGGTANAGNFLNMTASGAFLTFGGTAPGTWTQEIAASGAFLTFGGIANLTLAGKPFIFRMIAQPLTFRSARDNASFKMIARPYTFRGYR